MLYLTLAFLPIILLAVGLPIFAALTITSGVVVFAFMNTPFPALHQALFAGVDKYTLIAVPFFIFVGELMGVGGTARRIVDWVMSMLGRKRGGLAYTTVGTCVVFGAMSGSSQATVSAIGKLLYPPMIKQGYPRSFTNGVLSSSGAIDVIIPPSISFILYSAASNTSLPKLFIAGIIPGLLLAAFYAGYIFFSKALPAAQGEPFSWPIFLRHTWKASAALGTALVILGGIYGGILSPTEAGGVGCVYVLLVSMFVYRELTLAQLWQVSVRSMYATAQIFIIIAAASIFSWVLTVNGIPQALVHLIESLELSPWQFLLVINITLLIVGCFIDTPSAILVMTPLLVPVAVAQGIDLVHLGVIITVNLAIGFFTPPFGVNLFVVQSLFRDPLPEIYRGVLPFIVASALALMIITYVPELSLFLTR